MFEQPDAGSNQPLTELPPWRDCDAFCINSYSGAGGPACGWRGTFQEARREASGATFLCPRCDCATLLRIPLDRVDNSGA